MIQTGRRGFLHVRKMLIALGALAVIVFAGHLLLAAGPLGPVAASAREPAPGEATRPSTLPRTVPVDPVELVASDERGTTLLCTAGPPELVPVGEEDGADPTRRVRVAIHGFTAMSPPGAPDLPGRSVLVAIPAGARPRLRVTMGGEEEISQVRVAPIPVPGPRPEAGAIPTWLPSEDAVFYASSYPEERVLLSPVMRMGDLDVVSVTIRPAVFDPERSLIRFATRIEIEVITEGGVSRRSGSDVGAGPSTVSAVVNQEAARGFGRERSPFRTARRQEGASFESSNHWVRISVAARGLVRVDGARLAAAGVDIATIDPSSLRVFWGGGLDPEPGVSPRSPSAASFMNECAIEVVDGGDGRLDTGDAVVFLGQGASGWRDDFRGGTYALDYVEHARVKTGVYWLTWGGDFTDPPQRIASRDATPAGGPVVTRGRARIHFERNRRYYSDLYEAGQKWERWFDAILTDYDAAVYFPIRPEKPDVTAPGALNLRLWGYTSMGNQATIRDHYLRAWFNGEPILTPAGRDTFIWDGPRFQRTGRQDVTSETLQLLDGENRLQLDVLVVNDPLNPNRSDQVLMAWYDFGWVRRLDFAGEAGGEAVPFGDPGPATVEVNGAPAGARVFDVSDPWRPIELAGIERAGTVLRFAADLDPASPPKFLVGVTPAAPAAVEVDQSQPHLRRADHAAWYIVIAHDSMIAEATRLAEAHARHAPPEGAPPGPPLAVRLSDVVDEFGWGLRSEIAIRNFVDWAFHEWSAPPLYICLLGDASYDPQDNYGDGTRETDLVPAAQFWNWIGGSYGGSDYISDDYYVRTFGDALESPPDVMSDLYVGRIPAGSRSEAQIAVDQKTIPFLTDPEFGPWRQRALILADDEYAGGDPPRYEGFIHVQYSEQVAALLPPELERQKIYLTDYPCNPCTSPRAKPAAREAFVNAFSDGAAFINYIGHGAPDVLAHEAVFKIENVGQLTNSRRLPFFSTFSCTVNRFDEPASEGIGEALVNHEGGGSVASIGSTDLAFISSNLVLNEGTYARMYENSDLLLPQTFGRAFGDTKNALAAAGDTSGARKYVLLGDPALSPGTPNRRLLLDFPGAVVRGDTTELVAGVPSMVRGWLDGQPPSGSWTAELRARDSDVVTRHGTVNSGVSYLLPGNSLFRSTLPVSGDTLKSQLVVPIDAAQSLSPGRGAGQTRVYARGADFDAAGLNVLFLNVEDAEPTEPNSDGGPRITVSFDAPDSDAVPPNATLHIRLEDQSGINIVGNTPSNSVFMRIDERETVVMNEQFVYEPGSATAGTIDVSLPDLEGGPHVIRIYASDNYLNRSEEDVPFSILEAGETGIRNAGFYPNPFDLGAGQGTVLSFTLPEPAEVSIRIYTVSGKLVRDRFPEIDRALSPGTTQVFWDGRDQDGDLVANGVYLCAIAAHGSLSGTRDEVILRSVVRR